jgi:hypothetical protein
MTFVTITIEHSELQKQDREFLRDWAKCLKITVTELLKRIALAAVNGERYVENMPASSAP